jgi:hypothetical protein
MASILLGLLAFLEELLQHKSNSKKVDYSISALAWVLVFILSYRLVALGHNYISLKEELQKNKACVVIIDKAEKH